MRKSILLTVFITILGPTALTPVMAEDLVYVAVEPCRIVDTRAAGGAITANNFRNFRVSGTSGELAVQGGKSDCLDPKAGTGLKPLAVSAYIVAVPALGSTNGVLTAYPSNLLPPPAGFGSTVNFAAGQVIGNTTNITLCEPASCPPDGEFAILARNTDQHVVVDVQGYFYPVPVPVTVDPGLCPASSPTRWVDNGDGTVCDSETGLMWEKKILAPFTFLPTSLHNSYTWTAEGDRFNAPSGTVFTDFLARLNLGRLAGFGDWRIPTYEEARTLFSEPDPIGQNCVGDMSGQSSGVDPIICTHAVFGPDRGTWVVENMLNSPSVPRDYWQFQWPDNLGRPYVPFPTPVRAVRGSMR